jgi:hypothetical protein
MNLQYILILLLFLLATLYSSFGLSQEIRDEKVKHFKEIVLRKDFKSLYEKQLSRVRRVYPLALEAAKMIENLDEELDDQESKRGKRKITKKYNKEIKSEYLFVIKDLYIEEGKLLMKLIYRETGLTVEEIISKYKSRFSSKMYNQLGKIWDQNLDVKYDPQGEDIITEIVIMDIKNNVVTFDPTPRHLSKEEYKEEIKEYRVNKRAARKLMRQQRRAASESITNEEE